MPPHIIPILLCLAASTPILGQVLNIPDPNFKNALVNTLCVDNNGDNQFETDADFNNDGEIDESEALAVLSLKVSDQQIASLAGIEHFKNLGELNCANNNLTTLELKDFPYLYNVFAPFNQLTSLRMEGDTNLFYLFCYDNLLTSDSLILKDLKHLELLNCSNNLLTSLDVGELVGLYRLFCQDNQITHLFLKNGNLQSWEIDFSNNPDLTYICCDDWQVAPLLDKANQSGFPNCSVNSYCSFVPGGQYYSLQAISQLDGDSDGCDAGDLPLSGFPYQISNSNSSGVFIADNVGSAFIPLQEGEHSVKPVITYPDYFTVSPDSAQITFPNASDTLIQNFCISPNGTHHDAGVVLLPVTPARPGFDAVYSLVYANNGTETENAGITFFFDDDRLDFVDADPSPGNQNTGLLTWNFSDLKPFESRKITLTLNCNSPAETPAVNPGDTLVFIGKIIGIPNEETPGDNTFILNQMVVGSFDPNDKTCLEGSAIPLKQVGDYVHYLIRFENTGTYQAENIVVKDIIDTAVFDLLSLQITGASHAVEMRTINNNQVEFIFENINLPFTEPDKHGYMAFKIKTKPTLVLGNQLANKAEIYFDFNLPIVTNVATTTVVPNPILSVRDTIPELFLRLSPNPATDFVALSGLEADKIEIVDAFGRIVMQPQARNGQIDISDLRPGTYWVKVQSKGREASGALVKK